MASELAPAPRLWTSEDLARRFGPIPRERIRQVPKPGTGTVEDVVRIDDHEDRLCELVDGVLVEKTMGSLESALAMFLGRLLGEFVAAGRLGIVTGEGGMMEIAPDLVRIPDLAFVAWDRLPDRAIPKSLAPKLAPDLAVEILSRSNSKAEMAEKLVDYFKAGVRLVWYVDPRKQLVQVHTSRDNCRVLSMGDRLDGGEVLPGFSVELKRLFEEPGDRVDS